MSVIRNERIIRYEKLTIQKGAIYTSDIEDEYIRYLRSMLKFLRDYSRISNETLISHLEEAEKLFAFYMDKLAPVKINPINPEEAILQGKTKKLEKIRTQRELVRQVPDPDTKSTTRPKFKEEEARIQAERLYRYYMAKFGNPVEY